VESAALDPSANGGGCNGSANLITPHMRIKYEILWDQSKMRSLEIVMLEHDDVSGFACAQAPKLAVCTFEYARIA